MIFFLTKTAQYAYKHISNLIAVSSLTYTRAETAPTDNPPQNPMSKTNEEPVEDIDFSVPESGKLIVVDLSRMNLYLYENGEMLEQFKVAAIGKKGSPQETPPGKYSVLSKEKRHFSTMYEIWMPHSIQFFGNFFIHGWPYYPNGKPIASSASGGCIRLDAPTAEKVFHFADYSTKIFVMGAPPKTAEQPQDEPFNYFFKKNGELLPDISAESFIVADIDSGVIIKQKNKNEIFPAGTLTKLMTATVATEVVKQRDYVAAAGDIITASELLYPLLLESSDNAAMALANHRGKPFFVKQMNDKATALDMSNTYFDEPSGISDKNTSTAEDLFRLIRYLYNHKKQILDITNKKEFKSWKNDNFFVGEEKYLGGGSGFVEAAKGTVAAIFTLPMSESENRNIAVIALRSLNRQKDIATILDWLEAEVFYANANALSEKNASSEETSLLFVGDIMLSRAVSDSVDARGGGDFSFLFKRADFLKKSDILFGNLEGPISDKGKDLGNLYSFRARPKTLIALKKAGFDALSVANNHIGDWGKDAFEDTLVRLKQNKILAVGGGTNAADATQPKIIKANGLKIGFLGFSDVGPNWIRATRDAAGILIADENLGGIIKEASLKTDALVVSFHFGEEYQKRHNKRQEVLSRAAINNGAKIVVGHHPHVAQDTEKYNGGFIAYSLGNFIFDQNFSEDTMSGAVLGITLAKNGNIKSTAIRTIKINDFYQPGDITSPDSPTPFP